MMPVKIPKVTFLFAVFLIVFGCLDPYAPPGSDRDPNFLAVDGFINSGNKSATVKLSIAVPLNSESTYNPVKNAFVQVEGEDGVKITLPEISDGVYSASSINVQNGKKYQLRLKTGSKEYLSDPVLLKLSPVLDSITWRGDDRGITIYVDSHDVEGSTKYYQWYYTETWQYNADKGSQYYVRNGVAYQRTVKDLIYTCYGTSTSTRVLVATTTSSTQDVVSDFPLQFIARGSRKVSRLYSITVQQRALDEQAYNYWKDLQKTTENIGGLFDPLPSEVLGNMHNVNDPLESVLGYFAGGEVQEKRIFIRHEELPDHLQVVDRFDCFVDTVAAGDIQYYGSLPIISGFGAPAIQGYTITSDLCIDCRLQGGVLEPPSFWPR